MAGIVTYGTRYGGTMAEFYNVLKRNNQQVSFTAGVKAVENYVHVFGLAKQEKIDKTIVKQQIITDKLATLIESRLVTKRPFPIRPLSKLVSVLFRGFKPVLTLTYRVKESCNSCGICANVCPCKAITLKERDGKLTPVFKVTACDHCQACLQLCPSKAIRYMRVTPKSRRYRHPNTNLIELIKRPSSAGFDAPAIKEEQSIMLNLPKSEEQSIIQ